MNERQDIPEPTNELLLRLTAMIQSELLSWHEFRAWAMVILELRGEPEWLADLADLKDSQRAVELLRIQIHSLDRRIRDAVWVDEYVASLFVRHENGRITWWDFLSCAGDLSDPTRGREECEYFFQMLNELEARGTESRQVSDVASRYSDVIDSVRQTYLAISNLKNKSVDPPLEA